MTGANLMTVMRPQLAGTIPEAAPTDDQLLPETKLDWALHWATRGLHVFPVKPFLGLPIEQNWYSRATDRRDSVVAWWSETPNADIAAVPECSGHYVLIASDARGRSSLEALESKQGPLKPDFAYETFWGDLHLWFKGQAYTSHNSRGPGLHVIGAGCFVYVQPSLAPDPVWR